MRKSLMGFLPQRHREHKAFLSLALRTSHACPWHVHKGFFVSFPLGTQSVFLAARRASHVVNFLRCKTNYGFLP
jgi:hypothetical protein